MKKAVFSKATAVAFAAVLAVTAVCLGMFSYASGNSLDLTGDGNADISDVTALLNFLADSKNPPAAGAEAADINGDGQYDIADVTALLNALANPAAPELTPSEGLRYSLNRDGKSYSVFGIGDCTDTDVVIPSTYVGKPVTYIRNQAFIYCSKLTSVIIPDSVTSIGGAAFDHCSRLTSVTIGNGVTSIDAKAFGYCSNLTSIHVGSENTSYSSVDGILFNIDQTTIVCYPAGKSDSTYSIPDSVTSIEEYAFSGCKWLTKVIIGNGVTNIGCSAFSHCTGLTGVNIPFRVNAIKFGTFEYCSALTNVTVPMSVTSIGSSAFENCTGLERITYEGTKAHWATILKGDYWKDSTGGFTVYCANGNISKKDA